MARIPLLVSVLTAGAIFAASPLASADNDREFLGAPVIAEAVPQGAPLGGGDLTTMSMCGEREQVVSELRQTFQEAPMAMGQVDGNAVVEIFASDNGTWTILATGTDGVSCIISAGEGFESTAMVRGVDA